MVTLATGILTHRLGSGCAAKPAEPTPGLYEIDQETGAGLSRKLVRVVSCSKETDQVIALTSEDFELVFDLDRWAQLCPTEIGD